MKNKLNKGYIKNDNYCVKNVFLVGDNITHDVILGTPFLAQICPFRVNKTGIHTNVMGKPISFNFLIPTGQREISLLQSNSIFK